MNKHVERLAKELAGAIADLEGAEQIQALNDARRALHKVSPFRDEPIDLVQWIQSGHVKANDWNPNTVAPPEMRLLEHSIMVDHYTQPIVTWTQDSLLHEVVDGFHRCQVGRSVQAISDRLRGYLPVTTVHSSRGDKSNRMAATIRHNRARGRHGVDAMSNVVLELTRRNWDDERIAKELGMEADEVLRLKQVRGIADAFADHAFSEAWTYTDDPENECGAAEATPHAPSGRDI